MISGNTESSTRKKSHTPAEYVANLSLSAVVSRHTFAVIPENKMLRLAQRDTTATRKFGIHIFVEVGIFSIKIEVGPPYAITAFI